MSRPTGALAEVRSADEVLASLDEQGSLDGLPFMPEMLRFCGQRLPVSRVLRKTCAEDPADGARMRRFAAGDVVYLDGLRCDGSAHGGCGRACMLFWKKAWLRFPDPGSPVGGASGAPPAPSRLRTRAADGAYWCQSTALQGATLPATRGHQLRVFAEEALRGVLGPGEVLSHALVPLAAVARIALGFEVATVGTSDKTPDDALGLEPGEWVRVKSRAEIAATLDRAGRNRGLEFTPVMHECCGRVFRVKQRVDRMILEATGRMRDLRNTVILEAATCRGALIIGGCPRNEYHLWREIWLRRVEPPPGAARGDLMSTSVPNDDASGGWCERPHGLALLLGEFRLFEWRFPALVLERHHSELPERLALLPLPLERLGRGAEAAVVPSFADDALPAGLSFDRRHLRLVERVSHHAVALQGTFDDYLRGLRQKTRHELRRKTRRLASELGSRLVYRELGEPGEMAEFHRLALQVSEKTYQERLLGVGLPAGEGFRRKLEDLARLHLVRGHLMLDGERPIAYGYCEAQGPVLNYRVTGYDPKYRHLSPGAVLLGRMLESLFAEGRFRLLDFGWGEAQWKQDFATRSVRAGPVIFFRPTPRNLAMVSAHAALRKTNALVLRLLRAAGVKDALKRFLRSRATSVPRPTSPAGGD
jgi:hypothetical protein